MQSSRLVRAIFAVLVVATVASFFVTQQLKTEVPVVLRFAAAPRHFSPNGDSVRDATRLGFDLSKPAELSFSVIDSDGTAVRKIVDERTLAGDTKHRFRWDGRGDDGKVVPDGAYRMRVTRRKEGRTLDSIKKVLVDTKPPKVSLASVRPNVISPGVPGGRSEVRLRYSGPRNIAPEFRVWHTDVPGPPRIARRFRGDRNRIGVWDSGVRGGATPDGDYAFTVRVRDLAGNLTEAPTGPLPTRSAAPRRSGVAVRRLALQGPLGVISAGSLARFTVGPVSRRFRFALYRLGSQRVIRKDARRGQTLRVRMPIKARTGVYLVRVRAGGRAATWPVAVAGTPPGGARALRRARPLVVLPVVTWQGRNSFDSDLDGFPEGLRDARSIPAERPFGDGRLPPGFSSEVAPLLGFLDRERLPYDITTDLSLARREGPALGNAPGVAIAGTARWVPRNVRDRLEGEVERGGLRVVAFGRRSLERTVALVGKDLRDPSPPRPDTLFGERTSIFRTSPAAPLRAQKDDLGLFESGDALFGEFSAFERSLRLPSGAELLTAAGRRDGQPAFVAYGLGKGVVIRPGTPQWAGALRESALDVEVPRVTKRIWRVLSRKR